MNEKLLQAIVRLFAILARERITDEERLNIKEFLSLHLNREATQQYMKLFDAHCAETVQSDHEHLEDTDDETLEFVGEWVHITEISERINESLCCVGK